MIEYILFFVCLVIIFVSGVSFGYGIAQRNRIKTIDTFISIMEHYEKEIQDLKTESEE